MASRPIQPIELLDLADDLAGRGAPAGRPRTIRLRRSISSSYYALFHMLTARASSQFTGATGWSENEAAVARWINHGDLAELARAATGAGKEPLRRALGTPHPSLERVSSSFLDLLDARHAADYDDFYEVSKQMALGYVDMSRDAVDRAQALVESSDSSMRRFLALCLGSTKVARSR